MVQELCVHLGFDPFVSVRVRVSRLGSDVPRFGFAQTSGDDELIYYLYFGRFGLFKSLC